ncbi:MAG TPA: OsmC family protein [Chitinophagales bacterium]|nr:OsmC family protein [Chitinophagales bacterium]HNM31758.1 OsmC family protein [Chitinophagales bacterium]
MITSKIEYLGALRTQATHVRSNNTIITDAPADNQGKGEAFSPTDLLAVGLATCIVTTMGIKLQSTGKDIKGSTAEVTKIMYAEPRRIGEIHVKLQIVNANFSENEKQLLVNIAHTCPAARSLHPEIKQVVEIDFI